MATNVCELDTPLAKASRMTWTQIKKRILSAKAVLKVVYRYEFQGATNWDETNRRLLSDDGRMALQWQLRARPDKPISYENQQTSTGHVVLVELK